MKVKVKKQNRLTEFNKGKSKIGLKASQKRSLIVEYFLHEDKHFSVEELYSEIKKISSGISYSTVYRTLKLLTSFGLAEECDFDDGITRFEPVHKAQHHDHLICKRCGKIIEFKNNEIEKLQHDVAEKLKFSIEFHRLAIYGICSDCKKKQRGN
jgi:Fur family ferric uptake transcriptional regulator